MITEHTADLSSITQSWEGYWQGTAEADAWAVGGVRHPAIRAFWQDCFRALQRQTSGLAMLDIASGNGAVIECALSVLGQDVLDLTCVDISGPAVANIRQRFPSVNALVSDARSLPFESARFDMVTSQFGVEYAGAQAIGEAARMPAASGCLALVLHHRSGLIHAECAASLDAISQAQECGFVPLAADMFRAGFAAVRGAERAPYDESARRLAPAAQTLEEIVKRHGPQVAGNTIASLYADVARIHGRLPHYDPDEVLGWLQRMQVELEAFAGRMSSMMGSALDDAAFAELSSSLKGLGYSIEQAGPLLAPGEEVPLAWVLVARSQ